MRLVGNISQIKQNRENKNKEIELHLDRVEYTTQKKDGRYYQDYDFVDELDAPLIITGDCLALAHTKPTEDGEYEYKVFEKTDEGYELDESKRLWVATTHDYDTNITVMSSATYTVLVSNEEFKQIKADRSNAQKQKTGKGRKKNS